MDVELSIDKVTLIFESIKPACLKWREIGSCLGLHEDSLHRISGQCCEKPEQALHMVITYWLNGKDKCKLKGVSWASLVRALKNKKVNEPDLAAVVKGKAVHTVQVGDPTKQDEVVNPRVDHDSVPPSKELFTNEHFLELVEATSDVETYSLAIECHCAGLIPRSVKEEIETVRCLSRLERANKLYQCVQAKISNRTTLNKEFTLERFASILCKQENQSLIKIAHKMCGKDFLPVEYKCQCPVPCCQSSIQKFQDYLKNKYKTQSKPQSVKTWPPTVAVDYVNLQIVEAPAVKLKEIATASHKGMAAMKDVVQMCKMVPLKEVTNYHGNHKLILIEGAPGIGKTTVANKICEEWAEGNLFRDYDLIIYVPLRFVGVRVANSLPDLLQEEYQQDGSAYDPSVVNHIREKKGKGVLFLLDGWDELKQSSLDENSFLPRLIKGDIFPNVHCIVTSRPAATSIIRSRSFCPSTRIIQIVGFTQENIKKYIRLYFINNPSSGEALLEELHKHPNIMSACYVAINATIICYVFDESDGCLPDTLTEVYHLFVLHALKRHIKKNTDEKDEHYPAIIAELESTCLQELDGVRHALLLRLCDLALEGVLSNSFSFTRRTLRNSCGISDKEEFDGFGLVQIQDFRSPSGPISFAYFLHLTIQEFLAAYTISCKDKTEMFDLAGKVFSGKMFPFVMKFLFGLCQGEQSVGGPILDMFIYTDEISQLLLMECIYESKDDSKCREAARRYSSVLTIADHPLEPYQALACGNVMLKSKEQWEMKWINVSIGEHELKMLCDCLGNKPRILKKISLKNSKFSSEKARDFMEQLVASQHDGLLGVLCEFESLVDL